MDRGPGSHLDTALYLYHRDPPVRGPARGIELLTGGIDAVARRVA